VVGVLDTIKHNLSEMTLTTETIKTQVSGEAWMKQRRAEIKWECYSKLAEDPRRTGDAASGSPIHPASWPCAGLRSSGAR